MAIKRLTSKDDLVQRFNALCEKADELGLLLSFEGGSLVVTNNPTGEWAELQDIEQGVAGGVDTFPPLFDYVLVQEIDE